MLPSMRRVVLLAAAILFSAALYADDVAVEPLTTSPVIVALQQRLQADDQNALTAFWSDAGRRTTPLIESTPGDPHHVIATFLWRGTPATQAVILEAQLGHTRDPNENSLTHLAGSDVWYRTYRLRSDLRFSYDFQVRASSPMTARDPLNPRVVYNRSVVELANAPAQPWLAPRAGVSAGRVDKQDITTPALRNHATWVYLPTGYDPKAKPYPLLICFFGGMYVSDDEVAAPRTLDNLIAQHRIPPLVAVFIDDPAGEGNQELRNRRAFLNFMADNVLPWVRQRWNVTRDPHQTTLCGASAGGLASGYLAISRPDLFGNVLSSSGAFWRGNEGDETDFEYVRQQLEKNPRLPVRFVLQVGMLEIVPTPNNGPKFWVANHRLRDALVTKGYDVHFTEEPAGHEPLSWRGGLADGLLYLLGNTAAQK